MRSNVYGSMPEWFREPPQALARGSTTYRDTFPTAKSDRSAARATALGGVMLAGLAGLVIVLVVGGATMLVGAVGYAIWQL